jgi:hypothetical protein
MEKGSIGAGFGYFIVATGLATAAAWLIEAEGFWLYIPYIGVFVAIVLSVAFFGDGKSRTGQGVLLGAGLMVFIVIVPCCAFMGWALMGGLNTSGTWK